MYFFKVWKCYSDYDYSGNILLKNQCYAHCRSISFGEILGWITEIAIFILKKWPNIEYFMYFNLTVISLTIIGILLFMTVFLRSVAGRFYPSWPDGHELVPWVSSVLLSYEAGAVEPRHVLCHLSGGRRWMEFPNIFSDSSIPMVPKFIPFLCVWERSNYIECPGYYSPRRFPSSHLKSLHHRPCFSKWYKCTCRDKPEDTW